MHKKLRVISLGSLLMLSLVSAATESITVMVEQAETQLQRGETEAAIATLKGAITADPSSSLAHTRLGGAYLLNQDYRAAVDQFQQAISADNQNASAFIGLGMAYIHLKQTGPAKAALGEARRLKPSQRADIDALLGQIEQRASAHHP
ncbi:tetratricopeptide repeat protein [Thiorhodovibrio winogradskyi]|uniref:Tetratricopeptide repeat protein n=1 Tax=Thiorhodovibrio winogradskyi TaxID=77007 RepID=A0ABZ0SFX3_9GAMM|nr:tetratricopeptide repeat protein [Thiorhodovibrio winogradskyi]